MTLQSAMILVAVVLLVIAAAWSWPWRTPEPGYRPSALGWLGLAFWAASNLVP